MSVSDSFDKSDTSSTSSRNKLKSPHTVLKENQSNGESKQMPNKVSALMKEDKLDHYARLLKETEVTLQDKDSLISILKQQIKKVEDSLRSTLDELQEINFKYSVTQQELNNLKQISEKYKEDVGTLLKNSKHGSDVVTNLTDEIQVEVKTSNMCDFTAIKNDYGNINKAMQDQNEKIELLLKELKNEFERNQEKNNSKPGTSSESSSYTKCSLVNKLIEENKNLKNDLNKLQNENTQLIQKENNDEIGKLQDELKRLQNKINQVNESNAELQKKIKTRENLSVRPLSVSSKDCACTTPDDEINIEMDKEPKTYYYRGREGSKVGFRVESNQFQSDLLKENKQLHHTLNQLRISQSQNDDLNQLQSDIVRLKTEIKEKDDKLNHLKSIIENDNNNRNKLIKEFGEKENQLKEDYNKILIEGNEIKNQLKLKEDDLNEKDGIINQLQNKIEELRLSMNEIVFGPTEATDSRTQELKMSIETLNTLLAKCMEEKQQYIDQLANHANCKNTIDNLKSELLNNTEEIDKLNKAIEGLDEKIFGMSNMMQQYEEEVAFRNMENDKLKLSENKLQDNIKSIQLENQDLEDEIEKSTSVLMGVLEEYNEFRKECEDKINQLSIANADLKKLLLEKDINIESLKNKNKIISEDLQDVTKRREKDTSENNRSLSEMSMLFRSKEEELESVANELQLKEASLQLLQEENESLKERLSNLQEETALKEKVFLKSVHQEEHEKSDYDTNKYMEQLNEIKMLSINYDSAVKRNEELNTFLNKVSTELKELKLNLRKLLEDLEKKLMSLREDNEQSNNLNPVLRNNINDMGECIKSFGKSVFNENQHNMQEKSKTDESNQVMRSNENAAQGFKEVNSTANSIDANNLILKRNYLIKRIESIDEHVKQFDSKAKDMQMVASNCCCNGFDDDTDSLAFRRQNYVEQIYNIDKELLRYGIQCDCDLNENENYIPPQNLHLGESLQIMQNMTISLCNMRDQLTTKIRDYIINKDQATTQPVNNEKVVENKGVQYEIIDEDQASKTKKNIQEVNKPGSNKQDTSEHMCSCGTKETTILYKYEKPTKEIKSVNKETQEIIIIKKSENNLAPKQKDNFEPKLPHTIAKENNATNSKTINKDANEEQGCTCGIILDGL